MALPQLSDEQRRANLERAAESRHARAQVLAQLKRGDRDPEEVLDDPSGTCRRIPVRAFLKSLPGVGAATAERVMGELGISPRRRIAGLGVHQKDGLVQFLRSRKERQAKGQAA